MIEEVEKTLERLDLAIQVGELHNGTEYCLRAGDGTTRRYRVPKGVRQGGSEAMSLFVIVFNALLFVEGAERRSIEGKWFRAILAIHPKAARMG